jgi:hypothetical protein
VRRVRQAIAAGCLLASCAVWLAGADAAGRSSGPGRASKLGLRALQLNLCDSGIAGCFTGRSVHQADEVVRQARPDLVTLNEVCRDDVAELAAALSAVHPGARLATAFEPALDRRTQQPFRCLNGQQYGIGLLAVLASGASGHRSYAGIYPTQDVADPEERVWLCVDVSGEFVACTTHTASTSSAVALAQCRYLLNSAVPSVRGPAGNTPVVLGADLNLRSDGSPGPQSCLPAGYHRADDGAVQDIVAGPAGTVRSSTVIDMNGATDHPGLLVDVSLP